jgi:hypothetical protein
MKPWLEAAYPFIQPLYHLHTIDSTAQLPPFHQIFNAMGAKVPNSPWPPAAGQQQFTWHTGNLP